MKTRLFLVLTLIALVVGGLSSASASPASAAPNPAILSFESTLTAVTVAEAESGTLTTTLSWETVGMTPDYRLTLAHYILDHWELVFPDTAVPLQASGSASVTVRHPLSFSPPTYLLSIVRAQSSQIVAQRVLTIPWTDPADPPTIATFEADVTEVDKAELMAGTARVNVSWDVADRTPTSQLVFEQVFADGSAQSVELPRINLWVPSAGQGPVAPVYKENTATAATEAAEMITLRLALIDMATGATLAEQSLSLEVTGTAGPVQPPQPPVQPPPQSDMITTFTATPDTVNRGAAVTLSWAINGTGGVVIEQTVPGRTDVLTVVSAQSPQGTATVYLPDYVAYTATFTLRASDDPAATAQAVVNVHCPYTFFFGTGDGCPAAEDSTIRGTYQDFENGTMVWRSDTNEIYVHYDDGTAAYYPESTYAWMGEPEVSDVPPLERQVPVSGFGKVWANAEGVREALGWALDTEQGYQMRVQPVAPTRQPHPQFAVYFTLPGGEVIGTGYGVWVELP